MLILSINAMADQNRNIGLDILRIIAMISVTSIHFIAYSGVGKMSLTELGTLDFLFIKSFQSINVCFINLFVMLTGYFMAAKPTRLSKLFRLYGEVLFVGILVMTLCVVGGVPVRGVSVLRAFFPLSTAAYWYVVEYMLLYLMIPLLNQIISIYNQNFGRFLIAAGFISTILVASNPFPKTDSFLGPGCSLLWFCYVYLIGAYIRIYDIPRISIKMWLLIGLLSYSCIWLILAFRPTLPLRTELLEANCFLPLVLTLSVFMLLKDVHISNRSVSRVISALSVCSFNVYLIQESDSFRATLWQIFDAKKFVGGG